MREIKGLVSVVIPFYNSERFLRETVESVFAQTYSQWELLLVDDGSADASTQIAREYAAKSDGKILYLEHPDHGNRGVASTRNLGAKHGRGEFLAFLDSDDVWLPGKLEHQVHLMSANVEAGLVFGPSEYWYNWGPSLYGAKQNVIEPVIRGGTLYHPPTLLTLSYPIGNAGAPCPSSFLIRRSAFDRVGGFVESFNPETYQLCEDTAFLSKIYLNFPVYVTNKCTDRYRCHPLSIWNRTKGTSSEVPELRFYFRWLRRYLRRQPNTDPVILKAVRRKGWYYWLPLPVFVVWAIRRIVNKISR
jgi:glycosyltransferase involved in cell wall biosynthesis